MLAFVAVGIIAISVIIVTCLVSFAVCVRIKKMEELDEGIVGHLFPSITELFSLGLDIIVLVVFVVTVVGLSL